MIELKSDKERSSDFITMSFIQVKVGQQIKAKVELVKVDFVLVSLKGHAAGRLAYLPIRKVGKGHPVMSVGITDSYFSRTVSVYFT